MEMKYHNISYSQLHEICINCGCRYKKDDSKNKIFYPLHVLDEVMENVNMWVKKLPVNQDPKSWMIHSPNVTLAQRCQLFENDEYKRSHLNFSNLLEYGTVEEEHTKKNQYVEPRKCIEKSRVFEFISKTLGNENLHSRMIEEERFIEVVSSLTTVLKKKEIPNGVNDYEDKDLNAIFDSMNDQITTLDDNSVVSDTESVNSIMSTDTTSTYGSASDNNTSKDTISIDSVSLTKYHKYSTSDIIEMAKNEMSKQKFNDVRMRKKKRKDRNDNFLLDLFQSLDGSNNDIDNDIAWFEDENIFIGTIARKIINFR